jgi:hypothetical protein
MRAHRHNWKRTGLWFLRDEVHMLKTCRLCHAWRSRFVRKKELR